MNEVQPIRDVQTIIAIKNYLRNIPRNYIFFCMGIHSGLRVSDLLKLKVGQVRDQMHISFVAEKTKNVKNKRFKKMKFIIHPDIVYELEKYIQDKDDGEYLFPSRQRKTSTGAEHEPFGRVTAYRMLNNVARLFGLKEIGTHTLRKTWGYHLYKQNPRNLALLMTMFQHEDMTTTLRYIGLTQDEMDAENRLLSFT